MDFGLNILPLSRRIFPIRARPLGVQLPTFPNSQPWPSYAKYTDVSYLGAPGANRTARRARPRFRILKAFFPVGGLNWREFSLKL